MKKRFFALGCALALTAGFNFSNAQAVEEGNVLIDVYGGGPNLYKAVLKTAYLNSQSEEVVKFGGLPLLGVRVGYMVSDRISIGIDANYTTTSIAYKDGQYDYQVSSARLKAMARFEFHFGNSSNFDFYMPVGAGIKNSKFSLTSNDPNYKEAKLKGILIPISFKIGIGGRYYFNDMIGIGLELGLGGGSLLQGGLALKF